jgi:hypothetical protein
MVAVFLPCVPRASRFHNQEFRNRRTIIRFWCSFLPWATNRGSKITNSPLTFPTSVKPSPQTTRDLTDPNGHFSTLSFPNHCVAATDEDDRGKIDAPS